MHYIYMVKVGDILNLCDDINITRIEFSNRILCICYLTNEANDEACWRVLGYFQLMPPVEWVEEKASNLHTQHILHENLWVLLYFDSFSFLFWFIVSPPAVNPILFILDLHITYITEVVPLHMYVVLWVIRW